MSDTIGFLCIETDWDFGVIIAGETYYENEHLISIKSMTEIENAEFLGAFGTPLSKDTKLWEIKKAFAAILKDPSEPFSNLGGNRGASWTPLKQTKLEDTQYET